MNDDKEQPSQFSRLRSYELLALPAPTTTLSGGYVFRQAKLSVHYQLDVQGHLPAIIGEAYTLVKPSNGWVDPLQDWLTLPLLGARFNVLNNRLSLDLPQLEIEQCEPADISMLLTLLRTGGWYVLEIPTDTP